MSPPFDLDVAHVIAPARRRFIVQIIVLWAVRGLLVGLATCIILLAAAHLVVIPRVALWGTLLVVLGVVAGVVSGWRVRPSLPASIRRVDEHLALADRLLTAWEWRASMSPVAHMQRADAASVAASVDMRLAAPWRLPRREGAGALGAVCLLLVIALTPPRGAATVTRTSAEKLRTATAAASVAHIAQRLTTSQHPLARSAVVLPPALRAAVAHLLATLQRQEETAPNTAAALRAISQAQQTLAALSPSTGATATSVLSTMASVLHTTPQNIPSALAHLSTQLIRMSTGQRAALARQLVAAANASTQLPTVAAALQQAASALGYGDAASAIAALRSAASATSSAQSASSTAAGLAEVSSALDAVKNKVSGLTGTATGTTSPPTGLPASTTGAAGQRGGAGASSARGGQGVASGRGTGSGQSAGGTGGTGHGGTGGAPAAGTAQGTTERVYVPGVIGAGQQSATQGGTGTSLGVSLPLKEALGTFKAGAAAHLAEQTLPAPLRDIVGRYFATLNQ